jgi:hypothetical protein
MQLSEPQFFIAYDLTDVFCIGGAGLGSEYRGYIVLRLKLRLVPRIGGKKIFLATQQITTNNVN